MQKGWIIQKIEEKTLVSVFHRHKSKISGEARGRGITERLLVHVLLTYSSYCNQTGQHQIPLNTLSTTRTLCSLHSPLNTGTLSTPFITQYRNNLTPLITEYKNNLTPLTVPDRLYKTHLWRHTRLLLWWGTTGT